MKIVASQIQTARTTKIKVEKLDSNDNSIVFFTGHFVDHKDFSACSRRLGVTEKLIAKCVEHHKKDNAPYAISIGSTHIEPTFYRIRNELGNTDSASIVNTFEAALTIAGVDNNKVIEWDNKNITCCLDIDFDYHAPNPKQLLDFCDILKPRPAYHWLSKNDGLHLIYYATDLYHADELASVAAYQIFKRFPNCEIEFLHRTRAPKQQPIKNQVNNDIDSLKTLLLEYVETDCKKWLDERNLTVGHRYPHTFCPVMPSDRAKSNTPPVVIYEDHIYCYICAKDGKCAGSRKPGYFPISALAGSRINTMIATAVNNFVHWSHASHVLYSTVQNKEHAKLLYSSLLKLKHGPDPRIPFVFTAAEPNGLVRYAGYWCDINGKAVDIDRSSSILKQLPHTMVITDTGTIESDAAACEWLSKPVNHAKRGYSAVTPIRGFHITQYQELPNDKIYNVLHTSLLSDDSKEKRRPVFVPANHRMNIDDAWGVLEEIFPKYDKRLIELLIVGRGCTEHRSGLPPMLFIDGATRTGKTSHIQIASAICGDDTRIVHLKKDRDRFLNGLLEAKNNAGFVNFDEIFKYAKQAGLDDVEAMEQLLSFTENTLIYLIHIGSVPLGNLPFFIWTDTGIPDAVKRHEQIGRRLVCHSLYSELKWEETLKNSGIREPINLRLYGDDKTITACNAILSHVVERHFTTTVTDYFEVAKELGFKILRDSSAVDEKYEVIKDLFEMVCKSKDIPDNTTDKKRWSKRGLKITSINGVDPLYPAFSLCQSHNEKETEICKMIEETNLQRALGTKYPCRFECKKHGVKLAMRFVSIDEQYVNQELI